MTVGSGRPEAMTRRPLGILMINTADIGGGAELSAWSLFKEYRKRGHNSSLVVGWKLRQDADLDSYITPLPNDACRTAWTKFWIRADRAFVRVAGAGRGATRLRSLFGWIGEPRRRLDLALGYEDFNHPATWDILNLTEPADLIHCYNLHGNYFDLRALPWLSRQRPVILDLRDAWLLSGHCAHSFDCDRWKTGCGRCPDLNLYPPVARDGTAFNWKRKAEIFSQSRVYVATPSNWLMQKVEQSMLAPAVIESRVIPTGVDLSIFHPCDRSKVRAELQLPEDAAILVFAGYAVRRNVWKDYETLRSAIGLLSERLGGRQVLCLAVGDDAPSEQIGGARIIFVPRLKKSEDVARYFQAADLYVHAAAADTFPRTVLEALACGTPVVATGVGGIPEQIRSLDSASGPGPAKPTGALVPYRDFRAMALAVERFLNDGSLRRRASENAAEDARERFDLVKQADRYLDWYREVVESRNSRRN